MGKLQTSRWEGVIPLSVIPFVQLDHIWVVIHVSGRYSGCKVMLLRPTIYTQLPQLDSGTALERKSLKFTLPQFYIGLWYIIMYSYYFCKWMCERCKWTTATHLHVEIHLSKALCSLKPIITSLKFRCAVNQMAYFQLQNSLSTIIQKREKRSFSFFF